jgi:hypothetical protein
MHRGAGPAQYPGTAGCALSVLNDELSAITNGKQPENDPAQLAGSANGVPRSWVAVLGSNIKATTRRPIQSPPCESALNVRVKFSELAAKSPFR